MSPLACVGVCALVLAYNVLGAFLFLALEGAANTLPPSAHTAASAPDLTDHDSELRSTTVERLWAITEDLNILYKENWTKLAAKELMDFQKVLIKSMRGEEAGREARSLERDRAQRWTFSTSFLYALTLITTIGHGSMAPRSAWGRLAALVYACGGVPLVMLYLAALGGTLAHELRGLYARRRPPPRAPPPPARTPFLAALNAEGAPYGRWRGERARVPAALSAALAGAYVALGALVFRATERWPLLDGCYFAFASLATIGFGELRPGRYASTVSAHAEDLAIGVCCVYILVGIVVVAMCFNLVQEELSAAVRGLGALCGSRAVRSSPASDKPVALAVVS